MRRLDTALLLLATTAPLGACEDLSCCNSCGRNYYLVDDAGETVGWIGNVNEGGNECEIADVPRSFDDSTYTLSVEVVTPSEGPGSAPEVHSQEALEGAQDACADTRTPVPLDALATAEAGDVLCVVADVTALELCTQKGCASI